MHGFEYGDTLTAGLHLDTLFLQNIYGCDSTVYLALTVNPVHDTLFRDTICENMDYAMHGFEYGDTLTAGLHLDTLFLQNIYGCDSTVYLALTVNPIHDTLFIDTICENMDYAMHGFEYGDTLTAGLHLDTLFLQNIYGCDSTVYLALTVNPIHDTLFIDTICENMDYVMHGFEYGDTLTAGLHLDTLFLSNIYGCDSTVYLALTVNPVHDTLFMDTICENMDYAMHGFAYGDTLTAGLHLDTLFLSNIYGCDSTVYLALTVNPIHDTLFMDTICENMDYVMHGFEYGDTLTAGLHLDTLFLQNIYGCDSTVYLALTVNPIHDTLFIDTICENMDYAMHGFEYGDTLTAGLHLDTLFLQNIYGCDSTVYLALTVNPIHDTLFIDTICENMDYAMHGFEYGDTLVMGTYYDTLFLQNIYGCDSTVYLALTVNPIHDTLFMDTICENMDYAMHGFEYGDTLTAGLHLDTLFLQNIYGCDSTVYLALTVNPIHDTLFMDTICENMDYAMHGFEYGDTLVMGTYYDTLFLQNIYGCDSTVYLALTVNPIHDTLFMDTICENMDYAMHGFEYGDTLVMGTYYDTLFLQNIYGCDSTVYLALTVNPIHDTLFRDTICENMDYAMHGFVYGDTLTAGLHLDTLFLHNIYGCNSTIYLELTVNPVHEIQFIDTICEGMSYDSLGFAYGDTLMMGDYYDTLFLQNIYGCDSTVYLALTVNPIHDTLFMDTICENMDYAMHGFEYGDTLTAGLHLDTLFLQNIYGCDSTVYLALTVNPIHDTLFMDTICENMSFAQYGFEYGDTLTAGLHLDTLFLQNIYGCDSIIYLELMVNPIFEMTVVDTICQGTPYTLHGFNISDNLVPGTYYDSLVMPNIYGCDSTIYLELTVNPIHETLFIENICYGESYYDSLNYFIYEDPEVGYYENDTVYTNIYGCDSTVYLQLHVRPLLDTTLFVNFCEGDDLDTLFSLGFEFGDTLTPGMYYDTLVMPDIYGCDSTIYLELTVNPVHDTLFMDTICENMSFAQYGFEYGDTLTAGLHLDTLFLQNIYGCDSIIYLELMVNPIFEMTVVDTICQGTPYTLHGFNISDNLVPGTYYDSLVMPNIYGCDSTIYLELTVNPVYDTLFIDTICQSMPYTLHGFNISDNLVPGTYYDSLVMPNIYGCDSTVYLELTVNPVHNTMLYINLCEGESLDSLGFVYGDTLIPGMYYDTIFQSNIFGCDSTVYLQLQVNPVFDIYLADTICFGENYIGYGFVFDNPEPGINYQTNEELTIYGCDSIVTMALYVHELHDTVFVESICYGESYYDMTNNFIYDNPAVGYYENDTVYPDIHGCDSTVFLQLYVYDVYDITIYDSICEGDNYDTLGFYLEMPPLWTNYDTLNLLSIHGCDSIVHLVLEVLPLLEFAEDAYISGQETVWATTNLQTGHYVYAIDSVENCRKYTWKFLATPNNWYYTSTDSIGTTCELWVFQEFTDTLMVVIGNMCNYDTLIKPVTAKFYGDYDIDEEDVRIFPNPTDGKFVIDGEDITGVTVQSIWGQLIARKECEKSNRVVFNLYDIPRGTYLITIDADKGRYYRYIVVDK